MRRRLAALALSLLLAACQDVPHPFRHEGQISPLAVPERTSIADIRAEEAAPIAPEPAAGSRRHRTTMRLEPLTGLPGDGSQSLRRAMKSALERRGILVVSTGGDVAASLRMTQSDGGEGRIKMAFAWEVTGADGQVIGHVDQKGEAKPSEISGAWGDLARRIADGGADGLAQLVIKLTP